MIDELIKKAMQTRMENNIPFYSHQFQDLVEWGSHYHDKMYTAESYSRAFRKLRERGDIKTGIFKKGRQNGYHILEIR